MRYLVSGSWCEYSASLCIEANSSEEALAKWRETFADKHVDGFSVKVYDLDGKDSSLEEDIKKLFKDIVVWKGNGWSSYFGGYDYW